MLPHRQFLAGLFLTALLGTASAEPLPGQLVIDPEHPAWLKRQGGEHVFICGPGDPENFLYRGTRRPDGTRDGDQLALIDKLIRHGGNSAYLQVVRTHGGDAKDDTTHNPFVDSDPAKGLDARILDQWEEWFTRMDEHGILIYFYFYDDSARIWHTGDEVGPEERTFLEALVRRFAHHRNLIWIYAEESEERYTHARVNAAAAIIRAADPHGHIIGNHHQSSTVFKAWEPAGALVHYSMQLNVKPDQVHARTLEARNNAAGRYQLIYSENTATPKAPDSLRRHNWSVAMAGVMPITYLIDMANAPVELLAQCRHLQRFFEASDFYTMEPHDELAHAGTDYVLADAGRSYLVYAGNSGGSLGLKSLPAGRCQITWLDCRNGWSATQSATVRGGDHAFDKPADIGPECAAWIRFPDIARTARSTAASSAPRAATPRTGVNQPPVSSDHTFTGAAGTEIYAQLRFTDDDGPGPYTYTIVQPPRHGTLTGDDNDRTYQPAHGFVGRDQFKWRVNDGQAESAVATVTIDVTPAPSATAATYFPKPESEGGWRKLESDDDIRRIGGMDPTKFAALKEWLDASDKRNYAATIIRHGHIVFETERGNSAKTDSRRIASVSKAITAIVTAIASERSQQGLTPHRMRFDDRAFRFLPWAQPLSDPRKAQITVRQLLNHTSGISPEANGARNIGPWEFVLGHTGDERTAKLAFDPGTACGYSSHAIMHAALLCEYVTGQPYDEFTIQYLLRPLGIEHWWFEYFDSEKIGRHASYHMGLPARSIARVAYCMLHDGRWQEQQVIPAWFVADVNRPAEPTGIEELRWGFDSSFYAEGWSRPSWLHNPAAPGAGGVIPADARQKHGSGGQYIVYIPSLDLVVARQTGGSGSWNYEEFLARVCDAVIK